MVVEKIQKAGKATLKAFSRSIGIMVAVLLLISLIVEVISVEKFAYLFTQNKVLDSIIGASLGSIAAGNPMNSYILGGELLKQGIGIVAVTAFILSWVTVGIVQLPAEALMLGKKFAIIRNLLSFVSAIIIAVLVSIIIPLF